MIFHEVPIELVVGVDQPQSNIELAASKITAEHLEAIKLGRSVFRGNGNKCVPVRIILRFADGVEPDESMADPIIKLLESQLDGVAY